MQYPGPPRVGADRRSSDQDGLLANGVLGPRLESLPAPGEGGGPACGSSHSHLRHQGPNPLYDGIRVLYRHTRQAPHQSVMEPHPPSKA
eukprot:COSAG05_NODE_1384_length_5014_cov_19.104440_1_plen_88_part_10